MVLPETLFLTSTITIWHCLIEILLILCFRSAFFHVVDGLPPDVLHDILEGLLQYEVKLLLGHLINEEHLFTLKQLNQQLESFDYGYHMSKDKPSPISDARLHSQGSNLLGQSGMLLTVPFLAHIYLSLFLKTL